VQNPAMAIIVEFVRRIDPDQGVDSFCLAISEFDRDLDVGARLDLVHILDGHFFITGHAERSPAFTFLELQRQYAHADQIGAVNAFEAFCNDRAYAEQDRTFRRPVA